MDGAPKGNRTPVFAVRGRRPGPLDDGSGPALIASRGGADQGKGASWRAPIRARAIRGNVSKPALASNLSRETRKSRASCPHGAVMLVSVLMPTFNVAPYVGEAIKSILEQSWRDLEL